MGLDAFATVMDATPEEVDAANERWKSHTGSARFATFQHLTADQADGRSEAWIDLGIHYFWPDYRLGHWPTIAAALMDVVLVWPDKEVRYHTESEPGTADDALSDEVLDALWNDWWSWETSAEEWSAPRGTCRHEGAAFTSIRTELRHDLGQGPEMFDVTIECSACWARAEQAFRSQDDVASIEAAMKSPDVREVFLTLAGQRSAGLAECAAAARSSLI